MSKTELQQQKKRNVKEMILSRTIGIFYATDEWLQLLIEILLNGVPAQSYRRTKNSITFSDGTVIRFFKEGSEEARGRRFDKVYAEEQISITYFFSTIIPCCGGDGYLNTFVIKEDCTAATRFDFYLCKKDNEGNQNS